MCLLYYSESPCPVSNFSLFMKVQPQKTLNKHYKHKILKIFNVNKMGNRFQYWGHISVITFLMHAF
uniref:Uncharacterized protein n=1 Tax=Anguilla anguilla TaxID=7936 RepID=A0A0E9SCH7_ANGAN